MELALGLLLTGLPDWLEHAQRVIYRMRFFHTTHVPWPCFIGCACATGPSESRAPRGRPPVQLSVTQQRLGYTITMSALNVGEQGVLECLAWFPH